MCGRYKIEPIKDGWAALTALLTPNEIETLRSVKARLDVRPTEMVPVIRWGKGESAPTLVDMRWGFIPFWWKDEKAPQSTINARSEEAPTKPMWRDAVRNARCLIPCTGWYEWVPAVNKDTGEVKMKPDGKTPAKLPVEIHNPADSAICFAGLWSCASFKGEQVETCAIVTRSAVAPLDKLHDRMPVIVSPDDYRDWLNPEMTEVGLFERITRADPPAKFEVLERGPGR